MRPRVSGVKCQVSSVRRFLSLSKDIGCEILGVLAKISPPLVPPKGGETVLPPTGGRLGGGLKPQRRTKMGRLI